VQYEITEPIEPTPDEVELLTATDTGSQRHAFHSTMRGIAHLLATHIVMDPDEVARQLEQGKANMEEVVDAPLTKPVDATKRAPLPPRLTHIEDENTFRDFSQRLMVNTSFESIDLFKAQIVILTHLRTLCRELVSADINLPISAKTTAILRVKFDDVAAEVAHPSPEFAVELTKEEGVVSNDNLGLHRQWLADALRSEPEDRLERVMVYMKRFGAKLDKACTRAIRVLGKWKMPFVDDLPTRVLVVCNSLPAENEVPYCSAVARRTHMRFYVPDKAVRKRHRIDAYTLRLVRLSTMLVTMVKAQCFHPGTFPVRAVKDVAKRESDVADCVYKLCLLHIQSFWGTGMELVSALSDVADPSSDVSKAVDDALVSLSNVSTLELEGLFNVRRPTFYGIKEELHDAIHANLITKVAYGYHALGSDIGPIVLKRLKRRRSLVSWLPHETRDPLVEALWRHPALCAWLRAGGARQRQLRIAAKEVSPSSVGGRAILELVASAPKMVKYGRAYDASTKKKGSAKVYQFDSLLLAKFLRLTV
jgi:hypothetical protein